MCAYFTQFTYIPYIVTLVIIAVRGHYDVIELVVGEVQSYARHPSCERSIDPCCVQPRYSPSKYL